MGINKPTKQDGRSELLCCCLQRQWCCRSCLKP